MVNKFWLAALRRVAPCTCQFCGKPSNRDIALCRPCQSDLPANDCCCPVCAEPLPSGIIAPCGRCQQSMPAYRRALVPQLYSYPIDGLIKQLKYQRRLDHLPILATLLRTGVYASLQQHGCPDRLVPVPMHWRRLWSRGFNQAELLALQLAADPLLQPWQLQVDTSLCRRPRPTPALEGLDRSERARCMKNAFSVRGRVDGEYLVIVDDVMTSGATSAALARQLISSGAARVDVWCCARTAAS